MNRKKRIRRVPSLLDQKLALASLLRALLECEDRPLVESCLRENLGRVLSTSRQGLSRHRAGVTALEPEHAPGLDRGVSQVVIVRLQLWMSCGFGQREHGGDASVHIEEGLGPVVSRVPTEPGGNLGSCGGPSVVIALRLE